MNAIFDPQHFFDTIYCISLQSRADRRESARQAFTKLGILERVEFVLVQKHPDNPEQGIFESHLQCLKKSFNEGAQHVLIFEDDIVVDHFLEKRSMQAIIELQKVEHWDGFFLGAISSSSKKVSRVLAQIDYRCLTHAYALNRPFIETIIDEQWQGVAYDGFLKQHCGCAYAPVPMIAFQSTSVSDNKTFQLDRVRRFFGGLQFLQRSNELLQRYKYPVILVHLLGVVVLMLVFVRR